MKEAIEDIGMKVALVIILLMAVAVVVFFLFSVVKAANTKPDEIITEDRYIQKRYIDKDAGVVCYLFSQGISCLPISETELKQ